MTVELALTLPTITLMLFSIIEISSLVGDYMVVNAAARAGVRIAATGSTTAAITQRIDSTSASLNSQRLTVTMQYRTSIDGGAWSDWTTLTDTVVEGITVNSAPSVAEIRIALAYRHPLVMPHLFSFLADNPPTRDSRTINLSAYMQRE